MPKGRTYICDGVRKFYVYTHSNPFTGEVVYVGMGSYDRAWQTRVGGNRSKSHAEWLKQFLHSGKFAPDDIVKILHKGLLRPEALDIEGALIRSLEPQFNSKRRGRSKISDKHLQDALLLRMLGTSYADTAKELGVSPMTLYRYLKTKGYVNGRS